jgi:hypothetical protein
MKRLDRHKKEPGAVNSRAPSIAASPSIRRPPWASSGPIHLHLFAPDFTFIGRVDDADYPLGSRVHVDMSHFHRLPVASAVSVQGLHQIEL